MSREPITLLAERIENIPKVAVEAFCVSIHLCLVSKQLLYFH